MPGYTNRSARSSHILCPNGSLSLGTFVTTTSVNGATLGATLKIFSIAARCRSQTDLWIAHFWIAEVLPKKAITAPKPRQLQSADRGEYQTGADARQELRPPQSPGGV